MTAPRIKGQEFELILIQNNVPLPAVTDVRSFEMAAQLEILKEGYLGETTDRRDSVYRGYRGRMAVHFEDRGILDLMRAAVDKARRRTATGVIKINLKVTLNFPEGQRVRVVLKDLNFGEIPLSVGSRTDYAEVSLDFEGEDFALI